ncbi:hypothetical protein [Sporosarcina cascadiensis]|uniref:hypothetical protein n=1 Tax=Sporosarcina cascadiensis TaxID=2660747 RepID=UPI00129B4E65|nr:hypothetical protein [Sporosarcina cascadiensis]
MDRNAAVELPLRPIAKRTTVYLPASIKISKPTAEINEKLDKLGTHQQIKIVGRLINFVKINNLVSV